MRSLAPLALAFAAATLTACAAETVDPPRGSAPVDPEVEGGEVSQVDSAGGRDDSVASCFAACNNTEFSCKATEGGKRTTVSAALVPTASGCKGSVLAVGGRQSVELECATRHVCVEGGAAGGRGCAPGMFSAFSFAFVAAEGASTVCTRVK